MNTKKQKIDEIVAIAKQTAHYSDLLVQQCNRWAAVWDEEMVKHSKKMVRNGGTMVRQ
jgi:hypothetical protein